VWNDLRLIEQFGPYLDKRAKSDPRLHWPVKEEMIQDLLIRSLLKIRVKKGGVHYFKLNRAQREYSQKCGKRNIVLKARQVGITTYIAARFFLQTITNPGTLTVQVAHTEESARAIFNIVHRFWENLPNSRLRSGALFKSRSNVRQIVFPRLDSEYRVETADANAGRGMTIHNLHCSEVSRWSRGGEDTLASLRAAVVPDGEIVLESTPNGASGLFFDEWQKAEESGYAKHFFPWWYEASYKEKTKGRKIRPFTAEEQELVAKYGLTTGQIAWRRTRQKIMGKKAAQEFAEDATSCFLASGDCVFELDSIGKASTKASPAVESEDNGRLQVWLPPAKERKYIIGVDAASGGTAGDYACAEVVDREHGVQCAELHGHFPPFELARRVAALGQRYGNALVAVERNNHGFGVLAHLKDIGYHNLFMQDGQEGWLTSVVTRPTMIEELATALVDKPGLFQSPRLMGEMKTFVRHKDGSTAASEGAHDDCVMAMAIALSVRKTDAGRVKRRAVGMGSVSMG
jgi:hypothetical protein